jgi:anti-sigma factor ChrR (cupin superfamily)
MNDHRCFCELAPLYALDLLDLGERLWVDAQILECPDLAEELANYQAAVAVIPYSAPTMPMSADLKDRLFDRIADPVENQLGVEPIEIAIPAAAKPSPPTIVTFRSSDLKWRPYRAAGVEVALLYLDRANRMSSALLKAAAGVVYPLHQHQGIEEIYMLEGELVIDGQVYRAGDYIRSYPNSIHAPSTSTGCMFLIRGCLDDNYDENIMDRSN